MHSLICHTVAMGNEGVVFTDGCARCPVCGAKMQILTSGSRPAEGKPRVRSHRCRNPECLLAALGQVVKSVEA